MKLFIAQPKLVAAFTLVEVALALGLASFCLVAVMGLVPLGVNTSQAASDQQTASAILTEVAADLRATPPTSPTSPTATGATSVEYRITIPNNTGSSTTTPPVVLYFGDSAQQFSSSQTLGSSRYRLTVTFLPSVISKTATTPTAVDKTATGVNLTVSWPAIANPATNAPTGRVQVFAALDRN